MYRTIFRNMQTFTCSETDRHSLFLSVFIPAWNYHLTIHCEKPFCCHSVPTTSGPYRIRNRVLMHLGLLCISVLSCPHTIHPDTNAFLWGFSVSEISLNLQVIEVLFTIARTWTQPSCLLMDEWVLKCEVYIHNIPLFSLKRNNILTHLLTWINLKDINEWNQTLPER